MNCSRIHIVLQLIFLIAFLCFNLSAQAQTQTPAEENEFKTAKGVVTELYKLVTFEAGSTQDWEHVKSAFIVAVTNELPTPERPIPPELKN